MLLLFWMWEVLAIIYINDFITKKKLKAGEKYSIEKLSKLAHKYW